MKKIILSIATCMALNFAVTAQSPTLSTAPMSKPDVAAPSQEIFDFDKYWKLDKTTHDFGTIPQGPTAPTEFIITNISNEPLTIKNAAPSCGCTVSDFTKDAIAPGKSGFIKAVYNTQGRPGGFTKTLTIQTDRGTKPVTISGTVEALPVSSVPANEGSMIKKAN